MASSAREPADPLIGRIVAGKLEISALIERGGMGRVYRARDVSLDRAVAVKVLQPHPTRRDRQAARFMREARAASRLDHPCAVRVLDFGEDGEDRLLYLAMEYVDGDSLRALLRREAPLAADRAIDLMAQVCSALAAAHEQGVVHRDIKPSNILITRRRAEDGRVRELVKVCDFGLAKILDEDDDGGPLLTRPGARIGTPAYMSPEQVRSEPPTTRSDIYACGVILYFMLTGHLPFESDTLLEVLSAHLSNMPVPPSVLRPALDSGFDLVIAKAMQKDPDERYDTARDLRGALLALRSAGVSWSLEGLNDEVATQLDRAPAPDVTGDLTPIQTLHLGEVLPLMPGNESSLPTMPRPLVSFSSSDGLPRTQILSSEGPSRAVPEPTSPSSKPARVPRAPSPGLRALWALALSLVAAAIAMSMSFLRSEPAPPAASESSTPAPEPTTPTPAPELSAPPRAAHPAAGQPSLPSDSPPRARPPKIHRPKPSERATVTQAKAESPSHPPPEPAKSPPDDAALLAALHRVHGALDAVAKGARTAEFTRLEEEYFSLMNQVAAPDRDRRELARRIGALERKVGSSFPAKGS